MEIQTAQKPVRRDWPKAEGLKFSKDSKGLRTMLVALTNRITGDIDIFKQSSQKGNHDESINFKVWKMATDSQWKKNFHESEPENNVRKPYKVLARW